MLLTILVFIIILGVLVFVHEFGHFICAKIFKVGVEEFGFGYPPRLVGWKKKETIYSLNWIPIGGFTKIKGTVGADQDNTADVKSNDSFMAKPIWQRFIILFAGVFLNFILCGFLFSVCYMIGLPSATADLSANAKVSAQKVLIMETIPDKSAAQAGLLAGDYILKINNQPTDDITKLKEAIKSYQNQEINITILRNNETLEKKVFVQINNEDNQPGIGVYLTEAGTVSYPWYSAIYQGFKHTVMIVIMIFQVLGGIIIGLFSQQSVSAEFAGPIGIAVLTNQVTKMGFIYILQFAALLSINLAIFNLLPFPALDGGRLLFLVIEKIRGKAVNQKIEAVVHNIGFALLILLILVVTFKDISKYQIVNYVKNIFI